MTRTDHQKVLALGLAALLSSCAIFGDPGDVSLDDGGTEIAEDMVDSPDAGPDLSDDSSDGGGLDSGPPDTAVDTGRDDLGHTDGGACPEANLQSDVDNCGQCGTKCLSACTDGVCDAYVAADEQPSPFGIDVDATHVYWSNEEPGSVWRVPVDGGEPQMLADEQADGNQMNPRFLHLTATDVIVSVQNSGSIPNHGKPLFRIPKSGGGASSFGGPVADGTQDFVIWQSTVYSAFPRQDLVNAAELGKDSTPLAEGSATDVYSLAVLDGTLYLVGASGLASLDIATETVTGIAQLDGAQVRSDGSQLFIAAHTAIYRYDDAGLTELVGGLFEAESVAATSDHVFFTTGNDEPAGSVWAVNKDGSELVELAGQIPHVDNIAADEEHVWVVSNGDNDGGSPIPGTGRILRIPH